MKKRKSIKLISMLLVIATIVSSLSIIGFAKDGKENRFKVSPEECNCVCHGIKIPKEPEGADKNAKILAGPFIILALGTTYGIAMVFKYAEWFFTFQWYCKCGKPHFDGMKDLS